MATQGTIAQEKSSQRTTCDTLFDSMMKNDWSTFRTCLTDDVVYRVGSTESMYGIDAVVSFLQDLYTQIKMLPPDIHQVVELENQVIYEFETHYLRLKDNKQVNFACTDVLRMDGDKIKDWRVYVDLSPMYAE